MIRYKLQEILAKKTFAEGRRIEWIEVASQTGIHRVTLSKMTNHRGYNSTTSNLDRLCRYFNCAIGDLIEYVPDEMLGGEVVQSFKGPKANTAAAQAGAKARHATRNVQSEDKDQQSHRASKKSD